jgi:hypothetical protein
MKTAALVHLLLIVGVAGAAALVLGAVLVVGYSIAHVSYPIDRSKDIEGVDHE